MLNNYINKKIFVGSMKGISILLIVLCTLTLSACKDQSSALLSNTTSQAMCNESIEIDFNRCSVSTKTEYASLGSTTYHIIGRIGDKCMMNYGGEVENPRWNTALTTKCSVPISTGRQSFCKQDYGIDFSPISKYCTD
jgi:hypothetical protein